MLGIIVSLRQIPLSAWRRGSPLSRGSPSLPNIFLFPSFPTKETSVHGPCSIPLPRSLDNARGPSGIPEQQAEKGGHSYLIPKNPSIQVNLLSWHCASPRLCLELKFIKHNCTETNTSVSTISLSRVGCELMQPREPTVPPIQFRVFCFEQHQVLSLQYVPCTQLIFPITRVTCSSRYQLSDEWNKWR